MQRLVWQHVAGVTVGVAVAAGALLGVGRLAHAATAAPSAALDPGRLLGTPRLTTPRPGDVDVIVQGTSAITSFEPLILRSRLVKVNARLAKPYDTRQPHRLWVRWAQTARPCGTSYASGAGKPLGPLVATPDADGYVSATTRHQWLDEGVVRFCVWLGAEATTATPARSVDIRFVEDLLGAVVAAGREVSTTQPTVAVAVGGTRPLSGTVTTSACDGGPGQTDPLVVRSPSAATALFTGGQTTSQGTSTGDCPFRTTLQLVTETGRRTLALAAADARRGRVAHTGDCVFDGIDRTVAAAIAYVRAVGCRPGRLIPLRQDLVPTPAGAVWEIAMHGITVKVAPRGSTVDLLVNR